MVIKSERGEAERRLVAALRSTFDASVMNFGAYNLLYAENAPAAGLWSLEGPELSAMEAVGAARHLLVGYRREPVEMVLCPVDLDEALPRMEPGTSADAAPRVPVPVNLTNLAGMATEGTTVRIVLSAGTELNLDIRETVEFSGLPGLPLHQKRDVEDFYDFLDHFMNSVEHPLRP
ncbi:hypothetical protein [Nesterenkonia sp. NBAIMH1]|uniref:hypothetical protein n=1 Tax=Nesterenkonia sp. NBAIMH1 TaxID=2600320 RepID=UPI0011B4A8B4|nr:hypothetical protein [Nesterenkonia sp. NBAIMH1]